MYKDRVIIPLVIGLIIYGFHLVCMYQQFGELNLLSEVVMPIVIAVPLWVFANR
jgi:hypothetical protein